MCCVTKLRTFNYQLSILQNATLNFTYIFKIHIDWLGIWFCRYFMENRFGPKSALLYYILDYIVCSALFWKTRFRNDRNSFVHFLSLTFCFWFFIFVQFSAVLHKLTILRKKALKVAFVAYVHRHIQVNYCTFLSLCAWTLIRCRLLLPISSTFLVLWKSTNISIQRKQVVYV